MADDPKRAKAAPDEKPRLDTSAGTGDRELSDAELDKVSGGTYSIEVVTREILSNIGKTRGEIAANAARNVRG